MRRQRRPFQHRKPLNPLREDVAWALVLLLAFSVGFGLTRLARPEANAPQIEDCRGAH